MTQSTPSRQHFPGMLPTAFEHPLDGAALEVLRKTPGLDALFKKLASLGFERQVRLHFTADSLRLSQHQCPRIHSLLVDAAATLDIDVPDLYLLQSPMPNAMAIGMNRFTIVATSGLAEMLDDAELRSVLGHELGHIKSGHMLYRTIAIFLSIVGMVAIRNLPIVNLLSEVLMLAFYDWFRKSELTADRAGLLVSQDIEVSQRLLLKLAGGPEAATGPTSVNEFLRQADDYDDMDESLLNVLYKFEMTRFQTHPFPALRAKEITKWAATDDYSAILRGVYPRSDAEKAARRCGACGARSNNPVHRYCQECGARLDHEEAA